MPKYQTPSSPFGARSKPKSTSGGSPRSSKRQKFDEDDGASDPTSRLPDTGLLHTLATSLVLRDVPQLMKYIGARTFSPIPERSGFTSVRIAEILNFRTSLPPVVSLAHLLVLSRSPTQAERELDELVRKGAVRKLVVPGRGGWRGDGEFLVLVEDWTDRVGASSLDEDIKKKYVKALKDNSSSAAVPSSTFSPTEAHDLIRAGFVTAAYRPNISQPMATLFQSPDPSSRGTLASLAAAGSRAATGSFAAIGGETAFLDAGGGGGALSKSSDDKPDKKAYGTQYAFTLPNLGAYLKMLESTRAHVTTILSKTRYNELPKDILHERWDAGLAGGEKMTKRGLREVVLPAKTKKWKQFWGVRFDWILEECLGAGMVDAFETGSVGVGLRLL